MTAKVTKVERFILHVPFVDRVRREMERAGVHTWSELEITKIETDAGLTGWGETIQNYTWGRVKNEERVVGKAPAETMWDDSLGAGLQMALFDAAGKLAGVPVYRLQDAPMVRRARDDRSHQPGHTRPFPRRR